MLGFMTRRAIFVVLHLTAADTITFHSTIMHTDPMDVVSRRLRRAGRAPGAARRRTCSAEPTAGGVGGARCRRRQRQFRDRRCSSWGGGGGDRPHPHDGRPRSVPERVTPPRDRVAGGGRRTAS